MSQENEKIVIYSPDKLTIHPNIEYFESWKAAYKAFNKWKAQYKEQGYYSSNGRKIPLKDLKDRCFFRYADSPPLL
jgi:hypothetical protein